LKIRNTYFFKVFCHLSPCTGMPKRFLSAGKTKPNAVVDILIYLLKVVPDSGFCKSRIPVSISVSSFGHIWVPKSGHVRLWSDL